MIGISKTAFGIGNHPFYRSSGGSNISFSSSAQGDRVSVKLQYPCLLGNSDVQPHGILGRDQRTIMFSPGFRLIEDLAGEHPVFVSNGSTGFKINRSTIESVTVFKGLTSQIRSRELLLQS